MDFAVSKTQFLENSKAEIVSAELVQSLALFYSS